MHEIYTSEAGADNEYFGIDLLQSTIYGIFLVYMLGTVVSAEEFGLL